MMLKNNIIYYFLGVLSIATVLLFQNCGQSINLQPPSTATVTKLNQRDFGDFCAPSTLQVPLPQHIAIIIDMSASNVGGFSCENNGTVLGNVCHLGGQQTATDQNGLRFTAMLDYLNNCSNASSENTYAVIGFSDAALADAVTGQVGCDSPFSPEAYTSQQIQSLQNLQTTEVKEGDQSSYVNQSNNFPFLMHNTSYQSAFVCLQKRIIGDINQSNPQKNYKVLFLTDGKPSDSPAPGQTLAATYNNQLAALQNILSNDGHFTMSFQAVYYGPQDEYANPTGDQSTLAQPLLDGMAQTVNGLDKDTGKLIFPTIQITQDDPDFTTKLQSSFCNSANTLVPVSYSIDHIQLFALTAKQMGTQLYADSAMDGLTDDFKKNLPASYGFTAANGRSHAGVLDSLCYLNFPACQDFESSKPVCDVTKKVGFGFNECDQQFVNKKILNVANNLGVKPFDGLDYDGDGVLDYIELIKGTNMFVSDMNQSPGGDGISNETKLSEGLDPNTYMTSEMIQKYNELVTFSDEATCSTGSGTHLMAANLPFVDVTPFTGTTSTDATSILPTHAQNENVYVIIYFARPQGYDTHFQIFGQYLYIEKDGSYHQGSTFSIGSIPESSSQ